MIFGHKINSTPLAFDTSIGQDLPKIYDSLSDPTLQVLQFIAGSSPYLHKSIDANADWLIGVIDHDPEMALESAQDFSSDLRQSLRISKARVSLVLALCDLTEIRPLEWVTENLTHFADRAVKAALEHHLREAIKNKKLPSAALVQGETKGIFVLAMGKMGAFELNYSSDIDLIFFFDDHKFPDHSTADLRMAFVAVTRAVFKTLNATTQNGYVFRVDLRLRPNPAVTPVCPAVSSAEDYYVKEGRTWERAAFIKARSCAGDIEAGKAFIKSMEPFIWRRHLDFAALQEIEDILSQSRDHKGLGERIVLSGHNMKLGSGGIREIEFFAQTRQLIFGGRNQELRKINTIGALKLLAEHKIIDETTSETLINCYRFHRKIEHRIQMLRDAQTHSIPKNEDEFKRLSYLSGAKSTKNFAQQITNMLELTHKTTDVSEQISSLELEEYNYQGWDNWDEIAILRNTRTALLFDRLKPRISNFAYQSDDPEQTLNHFKFFLERLRSGVQLFSLFDRYPNILEEVMRIGALSLTQAENLAEKSEALGTLVEAQLQSSQKLNDFKLLIDEIPISDFESELIELRRIKSEQEFLITYNQITGHIDLKDASKRYTELAQACVSRSIQLVQNEIERNHGTINDGAVSILAMGKCGSYEMTKLSDLDLIVIYSGDKDSESNGNRPLDIKSYYQKFTRTLVTAISSSMRFGRLYEVDMRLRPSGRAGTVATHVDAFEDYQKSKAWVWEHLALSRARVIAGDRNLAQKINSIRNDILKLDHNPDSIVDGVIEMRERLASVPIPNPQTLEVKKQLGGILDIELLAQATAVLSNCQNQAPLLQLDHALRKKLINPAEASSLSENYHFYATLVHFKSLLGNLNFDVNKATPAALTLLRSMTGVESVTLLQTKISRYLKNNAEMIEQILVRVKTQNHT